MLDHIRRVVIWNANLPDLGANNHQVIMLAKLLRERSPEKLPLLAGKRCKNVIGLQYLNSLMGSLIPHAQRIKLAIHSGNGKKPRGFDKFTRRNAIRDTGIYICGSVKI